MVMISTDEAGEPTATDEAEAGEPTSTGEGVTTEGGAGMGSGGGSAQTHPYPH